MDVEIDFPVEFLVDGVPVSHQAKRAESRQEWQATVRSACRAVLQEGHFQSFEPISVTLFHFPETEMKGDVDNIIKPFLDAMKGSVYSDDKQVARVMAQKFDYAKESHFLSPSRMLAEALGRMKPLTYVRLTNDPLEGFRHGFIF